MDQLQQCPVCTLYLHNGMSMEDHLDTHPKDQVIRALCKMSGRGFSSRCTTPARSERSFCSRSQTPVSTFDGRTTPKTYMEKDRRKHSQRTPAPHSETSASSYRSDMMYDVSIPNASSPASFTTRTDPSPYARSGPSSEVSQYTYTQDQPEEIEMKYSRSDEYMSQGRTDIFVHKMSQLTNPQRFRSTSRVRTEQFEVFPKPNNNIAIVKTSVTPVQYMNQTVKPVQIMVPTPQGFVQAQQNSNMVMSNRANEMLQPVSSKSVVAPVFNQMSHVAAGSSQFTPATTVMTQNSQFFYGEMVHNIDGKQYLSAMPSVVSVREDIAGTTQNPVYQNVMVVNPYPNSACVYPPQHLMATTSSVTNFEQSTSNKSKTSSRAPETNPTLMIEVSPIEHETRNQAETNSSINEESQPSTSSKSDDADKSSEQDLKTKKGLKILSNIKVEVPIKHHKSMLNKVMDLTTDGEVKITESPLHQTETILPDLEESKSHQSMKSELSSEMDQHAINTFSVIKNIGNPSGYCTSTPKSNFTESKLDMDQNDSCSIPDLTCKEKASISPCSELSGDFADADNSLDSSSSIKDNSAKMDEPMQLLRNNLLAQSIYVKKPKKILQIKSFKNLTSLGGNGSNDHSLASTSSNNSVANESEEKTDQATDLAKITKITILSPSPQKQSSPNKTDNSSIETLNLVMDDVQRNADPEPASHSSTYKGPLDQVSKVDPHQDSPIERIEEKKEFAQLETMRPVNVIAYGNMSSFDPSKEFDAAKDRFASMMNDNYFGDNIMSDYFTAERAETFTHREVRETFGVQKTEITILDEEQNSEYMWGESSNMLPNFMQENYKVSEYVGESGLELEESQYAELRCRTDEYERVSKMEMERGSEEDAALDICADERMPPRGELSGQESNGDMDTPWTGMYHNINSSTSYDLIARETWLSDGSDVDANERNVDLDIELEKKMRVQVSKRTYKCSTCNLTFNCPKERRVHRAKEHPVPSTTMTKTHKQIRREITTISIKKEEKVEDIMYQGDVLAARVAGPINSSIAEILDSQLDSKTQLKTEIVMNEPRRKRRDYVCPVCKEDFLNELAFHDHLKLHPLECLTCGKYFYRRANLELHLRTHLAIKNYKCEVCEKRFITKQKLVEHHNIHTGAAPVKCSHCSATFRRHSNMIQHRNRHHFHIKKKLRDYVCHCGEVLHSRRKLLWHKETHDGRPKACTYCSDKFVHAASLTRHIRRAHNNYYVPDDKTPRENIHCPICKQVYLKNNIEMHLLTHTGKKPYSCVICNKSFSTKWNLKLHRWTHANRSAKPFKCSLCKGAFIRQADYVSHMNAHKSVRPYTCNYCGCQFIRKYNCQRHVKEHETQKKYVCKVAECGKTFHRSYYLTEHMRVHSGARPFSCNICGKTSSNKSNHNKHVKIHHAREPIATEG